MREKDRKKMLIVGYTWMAVWLIGIFAWPFIVICWVVWLFVAGALGDTFGEFLFIFPLGPIVCPILAIITTLKAGLALVLSFKKG